MPVAVPSLEGSLFLTDPLSIIGYTLRKYFRIPANTIPILGDEIISLPYLVAKWGSQPDTLVLNMQTDLQKVLTRIFQGERQINVSVAHSKVDDVRYNVNINIIYSTLAGDVKQIGMSFPIKEGRVIIPEDDLKFFDT